MAASDEAGSDTRYRQAPPKVVLRGVSGPHFGKVVPIYGRLVIGRDAECDLVLDEPEMSRKHAMIEVRQNDIYLRELTVVYANGDRQRVAVNAELEEGYRTAPLPLERGDRFIDRIELVYQAKPDRRGEALVEVWGDYAEQWLRNADSRRGHAGGWVLLGTQRAEMLSNDRDHFEVGERFGRFTAIRVAVKRRSVRVNGLRIVYGNGEVEDLPINMELREGQSTEPIDLKGRGRFIQRIELNYRSKLTFKGEGVVEVWGLQ